MIEFTNVTKTYKTGVTALNNINLRIQDGEFCFIVGRSGSGKSTLVRLLTKELDPNEGSILVNDIDLTHLRRRHIPKYRRRLGVVFQDFRLLEDRTVYENIAFAQLIIGKSNAEIDENVSKIMKLTGLSSKGSSYPRQLSGGEQQRTAIARALVNRPEILIADEPTGNLDHENAQEIMSLLERINAQGTTVIVITHDREMVNRMKKRTVRMSLGEIISDTSSDGDTKKAGEPMSESSLAERIETSTEENYGEDNYENDYEEDTFEENDDSSEDDFDESYEEAEKGNWEDDWDEDWTEPEPHETTDDSVTESHKVFVSKIGETTRDSATESLEVPDSKAGETIRDSAAESHDVPDSKTRETSRDSAAESHIVPDSKAGKALQRSEEPKRHLPEAKPGPAEKPRRGLKGSHRPHHKIGKEDA